MIADALLGIAAGALISGALVAATHMPGRSRALRGIAWIGLALPIAVIAFDLVERLSAPAPTMPGRLPATLVVVGGAFSLLRRSTLSPIALALGGAGLIWAATSAPADAQIGLPYFFNAVACILTLPTLDGAVREWRGDSVGDRAIGFWLSVTAAVAAASIAVLIERGALFESGPRAAGLLAAWMASSGRLLMKHNRPGAAAGIVAALGMALDALAA